MRVLHVTPAYYPASYWGGPIFSVYALNNRLARLPGISLTVLTTDAAGPKRSQHLDPSQLAGLYPDQDVVMTHRLACASVSPELLSRLPSLVRRADVVHLTAAYSFPTIPTLLLCRMFDKPLIWSPRGAIQDAHEWEGTRRGRLKRCWECVCNFLIRPGRVIAHTTSERERVATAARLPRATAMIVPNGVDAPDRLAVRDWLPGGKLRLMYLGRLSPKKGIENLIDAMSLSGESQISLAVYGSGDADYTAQLKALADRLAPGKVTFFGHVGQDAKLAAFSAADVCVVPSHSENFCMVVAEALAHGVPVIASRGTPWQAIEENHCGLWVDNSPDSLAQALTRIRAMDLPQMGRLGREWMQREFSWGLVARRMLALYQEAGA